jgi:hypothetical protein
MVNLGDRVRDKINGFVGIVTGRADYLYGCRNVLVAGEALDEKGPDAEWIDEDRVEVVAVGVVARPASAATRAGGPLTNSAPPTR